MSVLMVCHSRCLCCGRKTPHEVCHEHSHALGNRMPDMVPTGELQDDGTPYYNWPPEVWARGFSLPTEVCTDKECKQLQVDWR
jgi:hypothetical protein